MFVTSYNIQSQKLLCIMIKNKQGLVLKSVLNAKLTASKHYHEFSLYTFVLETK